MFRMTRGHNPFALPFLAQTHLNIWLVPPMSQILVIKVSLDFRPSWSKRCNQHVLLSFANKMSPTYHQFYWRVKHLIIAQLYQDPRPAWNQNVQSGRNPPLRTFSFAWTVNVYLKRDASLSCNLVHCWKAANVSIKPEDVLARKRSPPLKNTARKSMNLNDRTVLSASSTTG